MSLAAAKAAATAHWSLDEASGTRADDVNGNTLTDVNTVGSATGMFSNGADFESDNAERLTASDHASLSVGNIDFSISLWAKLESFAGVARYLFAKGDIGTATAIAYGVSLNGSEQARFLVGDGGSNFTLIDATGFGALSVGVWHLIIAKHDAANDVLGVSVNGGAFETTACSHGSFADGAALVVGDLTTVGILPFDGVLDDIVLMKNYAMSDADAAALWNSGAGVPFADWAGGGGGGGGGKAPAAFHRSTRFFTRRF